MSSMSFLSRLFGKPKPTASVARERLKIILAHERSGRDSQLQEELVAVISKYVNIDPKDIKVHLERQDTLEVLEVKIEMPQQ